MARQRMLERCGWKFLRIRGSVFYANQSKAIEELIRAIRAHGLEPCTITDDEAVPRDWVAEISGNECMEALGAHTVDLAEENIVQQRELFPEESEENLGDEATVAAPSATAAGAVKREPGKVPSSTLPVRSPALAGSTSQPSILAPIARDTSVSEEERRAILAAFDKYGERLAEWKFEGPKLRQPRLHFVLLALVHEGIVKHEAAVGAVYSRA